MFRSILLLNEGALSSLGRVHLDEFQLVVGLQAAQVLRRNVNELSVLECKTSRNEGIEGDFPSDAVQEDVEFVENPERRLQVLP